MGYSKTCCATRQYVDAEAWGSEGVLAKHVRSGNFGLREMIESSRAVRQLGAKSESVEEVAREVVNFLYDSFRTAAGLPACVLVRCFKTHRCVDLPASLVRVAADAAGSDLEESTPCLCLLAARGNRAEWNSRHESLGHQAIPLTSPQMVSRAPMISRLMQEMGLRMQDILHTATVPPGELAADAPDPGLEDRPLGAAGHRR